MAHKHNRADQNHVACQLQQQKESHTRTGRTLLSVNKSPVLCGTKRVTGIHWFPISSLQKRERNLLC